MLARVKTFWTADTLALWAVAKKKSHTSSKEKLISPYGKFTF
jgi:hypothetical protein